MEADFLKEDEEDLELSNIIDSALIETGNEPLTEEESAKVQEVRERGVLGNIEQGLSDAIDKVILSTGKAVYYILEDIAGEESITTSQEELAKARLEESLKEDILMSKAELGGSAVPLSKKLVEPALEMTALYRLGLIGAGTKYVVPATAGAWATTEYAARRILNDTHEDALNSAIDIGVLGGIIGKVAKSTSDIVGNIEKDILEGDIAKHMGGGKPKPEEYDTTPMQKAEDELKYFSEEEVTSITGKDSEQRAYEAEMRREGLMEIEQRGVRTDKETILDKEIKDIQVKLDKLDEDPEGYVLEVNSDLFGGVDKLDAYKMLKDKPDLLNMLKGDIEKELYDRMNKIDFIKRGDDRIEVGAKSDLYDIMPDSTKAEELAVQVQANRAKKLAEAEKVKIEAESKQVHLGEAKIQLNKALEKLNKAQGIDDTKIATFELEEALRVLEPKVNLSKSISDLKKKDVNVDFEGSKVGRGQDKAYDTIAETGETMSTKDVAARDAQIGIGVKSKPFTKQQLEKIEKQREHNRIAHEEFLEKNKDKLNKKYDNEADRMEYEKLVEQDKKYKDTDRALAKEIKDNTFINHSGGANGSDNEWGVTGEKYGVKSNHYYKDKTPFGNKKITEEQFKEGLEKAKQAAKDLGRHWSNKQYVQGLLARNWQQVKNADAVYAIGEIEGGYVKGGTGYAVAMAAREGKPIHVFDQARNSWFKRKNGKWIKEDTPKLTKNFAGIGTRKLKPNGKKAIEDAYGKTFKIEDRATKTKQEDTIDKVEKIDKIKDDVVDMLTNGKRLDKKSISNIRKDIDKVDNFSNWMADVLDTKSAKSFREIHNASKLAFDSAARFKTVVVDQVYEATKHMPNKGKQFREAMHRHLLETDYNSIKEFANKTEANKFFSANKNLYIQAKREIDLLAKSMKDSKHMNNIHWRGNGFAIAKKLGIDTKQAETIEKLASIKAMSDADWKFVEANRDADAFKVAMDLMRTRDELSADLFKDNPYNRIKGYSTEIYNNLPNEFTYKRGAIPPEMQTKIKGRTETRPKGMSDKAFEEYAQLEGMGLVLDSVGKPKLARTVASDVYKTYELGRSRDFGEVIGETLGVSVRKQNINNHFMHKMSEVLQQDNGLFNGKGDKFVKLTDDEVALLPVQLRPLIQTINKDAKGMLLGNMEVHVKTNKQALINSQLLLKDLVRGLKENVVLKNPVSYVNNFLFNYTVGLQNGISPTKMFKYQQEAISQYKQMRTLQDSMIKMIVEGKKGSNGYNKLVEQIKSLDLYKMHQDGLAFSVLSDITSAPSYSNRMSDKILKGITESLFDKNTADKLGEIASEVYLSPNARSGKFLLDTFTKIDLAGRYGIAKDAMSKGASLNEAVNKSNGIFGDLDKLSPEWVQGISEFGGIPFGNWFYRVSGGLTTNIAQNAGKAVAIGVGLYAMEEMMNKRTESYNPMLTVINSPLDMLMMSPYLNVTAIPVIPAVYKKIGTGEPDKLIASDSF